MKRKTSSKKCFFLILIVSIFFSIHISGASENTSRPININKDITRGIEFLYDWEFDQAENIFQKVIARNQKDPIGYFYSAMVTFARLASGFWTPEVVQEYGERIDRAISVARKKIEIEEADSFTYLYLGGALGFKGRFQLMQRKWFSSFFLALDAIEALKTSLKMAPDNREVLFGLGIFDYYTAKLSGASKLLTYLLIHRGNIEEGLRKLHIASHEAIYASIEAKSLLIHIYLFLERDHYKALPFARELARRFTNDPRNKYLEGVAYILSGMEPEYKEVVNYFHKRSLKKSPSCKSYIWIRRALYLEASYFLFHDQCDMARSKLDTILSHTDPERDPLMMAWPLVKKGMSYDLEGRREKALEYYKSILEMKNGAGAQFLAEKYIDKPAEKGDPFLGL
ncbi:MAG: hypothetical protein SV375_00985 [Thermodesulfobacteriota bacterium]|nr:hypothetical protein [Thermodesulfobacteriota bacterium]